MFLSGRILDACRRPTPEISDPLHHPGPPDDIVPWLRVHGRRQISRFVFRREHNINLEVHEDEHTVKVPTVPRSYFNHFFFSSIAPPLLSEMINRQIYLYDRILQYIQ